MVKETLKAPYSHYSLSAELSQGIDRRTIEEMEIDGFTLMEVAGSTAAGKIMQEHPSLAHGVLLCGKGNNGGDALVVARYLLQNDIDTSLVFISGTDDLSPDADKNYGLLKHYAAPGTLTVFEDWESFDKSEEFDFIVDGMLGTGLDSELRSDYAKAVTWANSREVPVFAMDIPTGLHPDSGSVMGRAIKATRTFAFGGRKTGYYLNDGPTITAEIFYCELPFPNHYKDECSTFVLDESWVPIKPPSPSPHKYDAGVLYIVAGSEGLTGAAIMAAQSAWSEGLGAVILICPRGVLPIYEQNLPPIIKKPVGDRDDFFFKEEHVTKVLNIIREKEGKVLLGPGLGRKEPTVNFVDRITAQNTADTVIDADGLWCLAQLPEWKKPAEARWILTPHPGELQRFIADEDLLKADQRLRMVRTFAREREITVLSKGMPGIIGTPEGECYITNYNTQYFSRAGNGDVLAGKIGAHLAFGKGPDLSCAVGLLLGKQKLDRLIKHSQGLPEPKDFI